VHNDFNVLLSKIVELPTPAGCGPSIPPRAQIVLTPDTLAISSAGNPYDLMHVCVYNGPDCLLIFKVSNVEAIAGSTATSHRPLLHGRAFDAKDNVDWVPAMSHLFGVCSSH
jgi:hypothetical protein